MSEANSKHQGEVLRERIAEELAASGPKVKEFVIDKLVDVEISRRVDLVIKGLEKMDLLKKEMDGAAKPDINTYDVEGKKSSGYSEQAMQKKNKAADAYSKFCASFTDALDNNSFDKLEKELK